MLPDRSKRYAGVDGDIVRLELAANWQLALVALLVLALLTAIFPRKALIEQLYQQKTLDDLSLSYVQNLYRTNPKNSDAALLLARAQQDVMNVATLESLILELTFHGDLRQRNEARTLLLKAYQKSSNTKMNASETSGLTTKRIALLRAAIQDELPNNLVQQFGDEAFVLNLPDFGFSFYKKLDSRQSADAMEGFGDLALTNGQYVPAASYYFLARERVNTVDESRRLFQKAIRTLMAASLFVQAMDEAKSQLGNLATDRQTLRFLARTALAAGDPVAAAEYARRLVFK